MDDELSRLKRMLDADPENGDLRARYISLKVRTDNDQDIALDILNDYRTWTKAGDLQQDIAIFVIKNRMPATYQYITTQKFECAGKACRVAIFEHIKTKIQMHLIPGLDSVRDDGEPIKICPVLVSKYPLTAGQYEREGNFYQYGSRGKYPITFLNSAAATEWCNYANGLNVFDREHPNPRRSRPAVDWDAVHRESMLRPGFGKEWYHACRGTAKTKFYWEPAPTRLFTWFAGNSHRRTHDVTEHDDFCNAYGLVDMVGNCRELLIAGENDNWRAMANTGGSYDTYPDIEHTFRYSFGGSRSPDVGFRIFASVPGIAPALPIIQVPTPRPFRFIPSPTPQPEIFNPPGVRF